MAFGWETRALDFLRTLFPSWTMDKAVEKNVNLGRHLGYRCVAANLGFQEYLSLPQFKLIFYLPGTPS